MAVSIARTQPLNHLGYLMIHQQPILTRISGNSIHFKENSEGIKAQDKICLAKQETVLINKPSKEGSY